MRKPCKIKGIVSATLTRQQFEAVRPMLEDSRKRTRPRQLDLFDVFCAIMHRDFAGCGWRNLPPGSPGWRSVHTYWVQWSTPRPGGKSLLEEAYEKLGIVL